MPIERRRSRSLVCVLRYLTYPSDRSDDEKLIAFMFNLKKKVFKQNYLHLYLVSKFVYIVFKNVVTMTIRSTRQIRYDYVVLETAIDR